MVNGVIEGIAEALKREYPSYPVYVDKVEQELNAPAFFIENLGSTQEQKSDIRYWRKHSFEVHFFPLGENGATQEIQDVATRLFEVLEYIVLEELVYGKSCEGLIRGTGMNYKAVDGVLHFFVEYNFFVLKKVPEVPYMESLHREIKLRDGGI